MVGVQSAKKLRNRQLWIFVDGIFNYNKSLQGYGY